MISEKLKNALNIIKHHCEDNCSDCSECYLGTWCKFSKIPPKKWLIDSSSEPEWRAIEFDIDNEGGFYNDAERFLYIDVKGAILSLMRKYEKAASNVAFGGWFYNTSCSWHKSLLLKPEVPIKIRFFVKY